LNYELQNEVATLKSVQAGNNLGSPPDGGIKAWLVAAGAACIFFSALGFANSFGVFVQYYLSHQLKGQSPEKVAWIGSVAVFTQFAAGAVGGPLFDRYGAWVCKQHFFSSLFSIAPKVGRTVNMNKGYSTLSGTSCVCHHDDQPLYPVLAVHVGPGNSARHLHGILAVPSDGSCHSIL
jgi:hypothetical protein